MRLLAAFILFLLLPCTCSFADITTGLIGWYKCDDNAGNTTVADSSGQGNTGTSLANTSGMSTTGARNLALNFNGTSDYVALPAAMTNGLTTFTIAMWIKTTDAVSDATYWHRPALIGFDTNGGSSGDFAINMNGGLLGMWSGLHGGGDNSVVTAVPVNDNAWHHVAAVNDGATVYLYLDGSDTGSTISSGNALDNAAFYFGAQDHIGGAAYYYQGTIDDVRIYNRALTASEIYTLYAGDNRLRNAKVNSYSVAN